ncbi:hypothetical protein Kyoto30A_02340 [Helicobacter pylori]
MNFFDVILGMFVEPAQKVAKILAKHASSFFHTQLILNTIISILFMIWAYKRVKEGDMFEFKTAISILFMIWAYKRVKEGDMFEFKTAISILFMIWAYKRVKEGDMFEFKTAMGVVVL